MSSLREREEKNCLNCGADVQGRFCHICGQENVETKESVWHLVTHFFKDITHFDGKFFNTVRHLVTRPGFLPKEYMNGRRVSYVNPVRLYVFTSAFFFLIFFTFTAIEQGAVVKDVKMNGKTYNEIMAMDSVAYDSFIKDRFRNADSATKAKMPLNKTDFKIYFDSSLQKGFTFIAETKYSSKEAYDSLLETGKDDSWIRRQITYKEIEINKKYNNNFSQFFVDFNYLLAHSLPQMFFAFLPLFALLLKLLYIRRKRFFYVDHAIFTVHFYIFTFLLLLVVFGIGELGNRLGWRVFDWLQLLLFAGLFVYLYKAMRRFYQQSGWKTILKFFLLCISLLFTLLTLFIFFIVFNYFKI